MRRRLLAIAAIGFAALAAAAQEEAPVRTEEVIWSLMSFNGRDYSPTFCRQGEPTVCLIAGSDNFVTVRSTLVYYWPTTGDWYTDSRTLNVSHAGALEVADGRGRVRRLEPVAYTYFSVQERYGQSWQVRLDAEAEAEWQRYSRLVDDYRAAAEAYGLARATWEEQYAALARRIATLREDGRPVAAEMERLDAMRPPEEPREPAAYLVPPVPVRTGFVLRLDPGTYTARLVTPAGFVLEGSDKTIVVHDRRGTGVIGYDIIPSDRWTRTAESNTPASVIYTTGGADLYIRPFVQDEYNDFYYRKTIRNDAGGNPTLVTWVKVRQVERAEIEVTAADGRVTRLAEAPFSVVQSEGTALGYAIVPFDQATALAGEEPTLRAFAIRLGAQPGTVRLRLYDGEGALRPSGERQIRIVRMPRRPSATLGVAVLPLAAGLVVLLRRRRNVER